MKLLFKKLTPSATIPSYMHEGDSGMDVHSIETRSIGHEGCIHVFRTGIGAVIPEGYELQVPPPSRGSWSSNATACLTGPTGEVTGSEARG